MNTEHLIHALAAHIDHDEPPGMAANSLARAVVSLVRERESTQAVLLAAAINRLALDGKYPRDGAQPRAESMDFSFTTDDYPHLAACLLLGGQLREEREKAHEELKQLLRDARADAVRFIADVKVDELQKAYEQGRKEVEEAHAKMRAET